MADIEMDGIGRVRDAAILGIFAGLILSIAKWVSASNLVSLFLMLSLMLGVSYAFNKSFIKGQMGGFISGLATGAGIGQII